MARRWLVVALVAVGAAGAVGFVVSRPDDRSEVVQSQQAPESGQEAPVAPTDPVAQVALADGSQLVVGALPGLRPSVSQQASGGRSVVTEIGSGKVLEQVGTSKTADYTSISFVGAEDPEQEPVLTVTASPGTSKDLEGDKELQVVGSVGEHALFGGARTPGADAPGASSWSSVVYEVEPGRLLWINGQNRSVKDLQSYVAQVAIERGTK